MMIIIYSQYKQTLIDSILWSELFLLCKKCYKTVPEKRESIRSMSPASDGRNVAKNNCRFPNDCCSEKLFYGWNENFQTWLIKLCQSGHKLMNICYSSKAPETNYYRVKQRARYGTIHSKWCPEMVQMGTPPTKPQSKQTRIGVCAYLLIKYE